MKTLLKKHWKSLLAFSVVTIIIIPFIIHICFKINTPIKFFQAEWSAGDVLAFYGVLVGAVATVWGVYLSIQYSRSNYQEDVKNRVLPFIALTRLKTKSKWSPFIVEDELSETEEKCKYEEYVISEVYFVISNGSIEAKSALTKEQQKKIERGGCCWRDNGGGRIQLVAIDLLSLPLELENVGNGVANLFTLGLNKTTVSESEWKYLTPMPVKVGQTIYIHIYCEDGSASIGTYYLDTIYEDIYRNKYRQRYAVVITDPNDTVHSYLELSGKQEKI